MMENVKSSTERQKNYAREYSRYSRAIKYSFYLEAIAIIYAIIEDRLVSALHHMGVVSRQNDDLRINSAVYPYMRELMGKDEKSAILVKNVSVKIEIINQLLHMDEKQSLEIDDKVEALVKAKHKRGIPKKGYMHDLYLLINDALDKEEVEALFQDFHIWKDTRNKLIHALLNKTAKSSESAKEECAERGYKLSRRFDEHLSDPIKRNSKIRKKYKIQ